MTTSSPVAPTTPVRRPLASGAFVAIAVLGLVVVAVLAGLLGGAPDSGIETDPASPGPSGSAALVALLREHSDVDVRIVRSAAELDQLTLPRDGETTLLVSDADRLNPNTTNAVGVWLDEVRLVLVNPNAQVLADLEIGAQAAGRTGGVLRAQCESTSDTNSNSTAGAPAVTDVRAGEQIDVGVATLWTPTTDEVGTGCFPAGSPAGATAATGKSSGSPSSGSSDTGTSKGTGTGTGTGALTRGSAYLRLTTTAEPGQLASDVVLLGSTSLLTNERLAAADNAAIAMRTLGAGKHLIWYLPNPADKGVGGRPAQYSSPAPPWFGPGVLVLLGAGVALMLWRGRRLGPLAIEPLPVVVRASETSDARARLYQRTGDGAAMARILIDGATTRLAARLGQPAGTSPHAVAAAAATATGEDPARIHALLTPPATLPAKAIPTLIADLRRLEREVARS